MILVLTGTQNMPFARLIDGVLSYLRDRQLAAIIQAGPYKAADIPPGVSYRGYLSPGALNDYLTDCSLLITHGGTGSIIAGLEKGKKVIVMPRRKAYGEHNDDHQVEIAELFQKEGHVLLWRDGEDLATLMSEVVTFSPEPYQSGFEQLAESIRADVQRYIE